MKWTSPIFATLSGSMGGVTGRHNRYGQYLANKVKPVNPQSTRQEAARLKLSYLTSVWNSAAMDGYRAGWSLYAANLPATPGSTNPTGFNFFISCNSVRMWCYGTPILIPPAVYTLPAPDPAFAVTISAATQLMSIAFTPAMAQYNELKGALVVSMGMPKMNTGLYFNGPYRQSGLVDGAVLSPPTSPHTIATPWPVTEGQRVWVNARVLRADGRLSNPFRAYCIVGA